MAKRKSRSKKADDIYEDAELEGGEFSEEELGEELASEDESKPQDETFAEAKGLPANAHAKALAKEKAKAKPEPHASFYTQKGQKIIKVVVKVHGHLEVYIGNMVRHKADLNPIVDKWKKEGKWVEPLPSLIKEKILALRAQIVPKKKK